MQNRVERISALICKYTIGALDPEERCELDAWIRESETNKEQFTRLTNPDFLEGEYRRLKNIRTERVLADMKRRIACSTPLPVVRRRITLRTVCCTVAAAVLLAVGVFVALYNMELAGSRASDAVAMNDYTMIKHGETRAVLTLANGLSVSLGSDSLLNLEAVSRVMGVSDSVAEHSTLRTEHADAGRKLNLSIPRGGEFRFTLEDGTEVWLNAESQLVYPETFTGDERRVTLLGEAYFKVAKDAGKPFIVESAGQEVRVTGTEFNVQCYESESNVYTTLVSGGIALKPLAAHCGELLLTPGHQVVLNRSDSHADVRSVDTNVVTSWKDGRFVCENQTLEQIVRMLSRWYDFTYEFKDEDIKNTLFMGSIPRYAAFDDVARILEASGGIRLEADGRNLLIFRK